ncbi:MAG TPA: glycosyltransferase family 4 protein [Candidatus Omnitrophota bacterium]|nr:glycosyltransferase family 4 protein [Candidatus Omnitrophota bacterium]
MARLKIAHVITRLDWGGSPDILRILVEGLYRDKYDVTVISGPTLHLTQKTRTFLDSFRGRYVEIGSLRRDVDLSKDIPALFRLYTLMLKERFDIVHTHTAKAGFLGRISARMAGCRAIVHTPHGHNLYGYFDSDVTEYIKRAERFAGKFCDKIIALTELEKKDMVRFKLAPEEKIEVIYQGLELERYRHRPERRALIRQSLNIPEGAMVVGTVARLEPVKGPDIFLEAAEMVGLEYPASYFIMAGDGDMREALKERSRHLSIKDRIIFTGWREDIPDIMSGLDIFALPSLNEAVGMALIEAQAAGVASVASRVGGIPEVVQDGKTGILVEPGNPRALAEAISGLISDGEKRRRIAEAGWSFVSGKFRAEDMVSKVSDLYDRIRR